MTVVILGEAERELPIQYPTTNRRKQDLAGASARKWSNSRLENPEPSAKAAWRNGLRLSLRRGDQGDDVALVAAIHAKVLVDGDDAVLRMELAHPNEAEVGQVWFAITIAFG